MRAKWRCALVAIAVVVCSLTSSAQAKDLAFDLPAQKLRSAIEQLSVPADVQVLYATELVEGKVSAPLQGEYSVEEALERLLAGTGLVFRRAGSRTILIERSADVRAIGVVRVPGSRPLARRGANGSSDVLATEGSGNYAARGAGVGSPFPQVLKDTPRSISVLGHSQIEDQNLTELGDALRRMSAVSVAATAADAALVSVRGRPMEFFQFDGGPSVRALDGILISDLSAYDRIELLSGVDGLGNGFAPPSGTLNLVRKRPLDHAQTVIDAQLGSWSQYRGMLDVSAPPFLDGRMRSRAVVSGVDRDLFFDNGEQQRQSYYGVFEADLRPGTLLRVGGHAVEQRGTPWEGSSLPRDTSGEFVEPPGDRSLSFALPWSRHEIRQRQVFVALEQSLMARWTARLSFDQLRYARESLNATFQGTVNPETGRGGGISGLLRDNRNAYLLSDLAVNGRFDLLGREHVLSLGMNHARTDLQESSAFLGSQVVVDAYNFDAADYPPPSIEGVEMYPSVDARNIRYGGTAALTLNPTDALSLITAWRWSAWVPDDRSRVRRRKHGISYVGATWALDARSSLYASWADAFTANHDVFVSGGGWLAPTERDNYEVGLKYASVDARLQARVTLFRSERSNLPVEIEDLGDWCCFVASRSERDRAQGVEAEIVGTLLSGWELAAGYTYTDLWERYTPASEDIIVLDPRDINADRLTPRHALRIWTAWEPRNAALPGLKLGGGLRAQGKGLRNAGNYEGPARQDAFTIVDLMASWRFDPSWTAGVNVRNLFDRSYYESVAFQAFYGEPRSIVVSLQWVI